MPNLTAAEIQARYKARHPARVHARQVVNDRLKRGKLTPGDTCWHCGLPGALEAHHPSYAAGHELDVCWVHPGCHDVIHEGERVRPDVRERNARTGREVAELIRPLLSTERLSAREIAISLGIPYPHVCKGLSYLWREDKTD